MSDTTQLTCVVNVKLRDDIDEYAAQTSREVGLVISRSGAMEILLRAGLAVKRGKRTR